MEEEAELLAGATGLAGEAKPISRERAKPISRA
jgi:hypothetical protein